MAMAFNIDGGGNSAFTFRQFAKLAKRIVPQEIDWLVALDGGLSAFLFTHDKEYSPTYGAALTYFCAE